MIHFVGAGSGAVDLITVRGMNLLKKADCVIYAGSLVNKELLDYCRDGIEIYDSAYMDLEEVIAVIDRCESEGKDIVRLHTGDPSLYGAIGEQIEYLKEKNIAYDVTPGVTAAFSAAAAIGQELTLPGITQTLIFTRVEGKTPMPDRESIKELAKIGATMAVYLSAGLVKKLRDELLAGGYREDTPVAVCHRISWKDQKIFITNVGNMVSCVDEHELKLTTLFLVGDVIGSVQFDKSKLYDPEFQTIFREARK